MFLQLVFDELLERVREKEEKEAKKRRRLMDDFSNLLSSIKVSMLQAWSKFQFSYFRRTKGILLTYFMSWLSNLPGVFTFSQEINASSEWGDCKSLFDNSQAYRYCLLIVEVIIVYLMDCSVATIFWVSNKGFAKFLEWIICFHFDPKKKKKPALL